MLSKAIAPTKSFLSKSRPRRSSEDSALKKQVQETHAYDGREVDVESILVVIKNILNLVSPGIDGVLNGWSYEHTSIADETTGVLGVDGIDNDVAFLFNKISCELSCKCSGEDASTSTMEILNVLSSYTWEAKAVVALGAFTVNYGQFWLIANHFTTHPLAKSLAILKQLPKLFETLDVMKSRFDTTNNLVKVSFELTQSIVALGMLPAKYITDDAEPMANAMNSVPLAVYWIIRSLVACAGQVTETLNLAHSPISFTSETWELSSLVQRVAMLQEHIKKQLSHCHEYIDGKKHKEYFDTIVHLFSTTPHYDNQRILKQLIHLRNDPQPLIAGMDKGKKVGVEYLKEKTVLLLISDLEISHDEISILERIYAEMRSSPVVQSDIVWIPMVEKDMLLDEERKYRFEELQNVMPWYVVHNPSMLEPAVARYIKEVWRFSKKTVIVALDPQGRVASTNAIHMIHVWENSAYPFSSAKEWSLWEEEKWSLRLVVDGIDQIILTWIEENAIICLYGGENENWIRQFVPTARAAASAARVRLEMVYIGNSTSKERARRFNDLVTKNGLGHCINDLSLIWFFWMRMESMMHSKLQHGAKVPTPDQPGDHILAEVLNMLTFQGDDELGWAVFSQGSGIEEDKMARAKGKAMAEAFEEYEKWLDQAQEKEFVPALNDYLRGHHDVKHCNKLVLPGVEDVPEMVVCTECHKPMDKYFMYRCCND